ncbi:MAG: phage portal protein [Vallitalea sp.]|jgi:HK97 family phage portal protein|nr:phage portal protein [Vallitalea sp.]
MRWWNKKKEPEKVVVVEERSMSLQEILDEMYKNKDTITLEEAKQIPIVATGLNLIKNTIGSLKVDLYKESNGKTTIFNNDYRVKLLNVDCKDTLDALDMRCSMIDDYLLNGNGYAYINKKRNIIQSINYVDSINVSIQNNFDPIFKSFDVIVNGETFRDFEFLKLLQNTKNGGQGKGLMSNQKMLSIAYNQMLYENMLVKKGGNKSGFLQSESKLTPEALAELKENIPKMQNNESDTGIVVLNKGTTFKESSMSSVEMQLNELKQRSEEQIAKILNIPLTVLKGNGTTDDYKNFIKICIKPILTKLELIYKRGLLLEKEIDEGFYFKFNTDDLTKADLKDRVEAYKSAVEGGLLTINEARNKMDEERLEGMDIMSKSLGDVIFDIKTQTWYTPNMDSTTDLSKNKTQKEGEKTDEVGDKK